MKLLRSIYAGAVEQGHLGRNPFAGVDRLREREDAGRRVPFTTSEVAALIEMAEGDWKGLVILAATTGLRLLDAARLQWSSLDLGEGLIRVRTSKTGVVLVLPVHPKFDRWLSQQPGGIREAPVFPTLASKGGSGKSGLSMAFKRLMDRANVDQGIARVAREGGRGRTTSQKSFHSLRHFAATQMASNGVRADVARATTGHLDVETHSNYVTAELSSLRKAVDGIEF